MKEWRHLNTLTYKSVKFGGINFITHTLLLNVRQVQIEPGQQCRAQYFNAEIAGLVDVPRPLRNALQVILRGDPSLVILRHVIELHLIELEGDFGEVPGRKGILLDEIVQCMLAAELGLLSLVIDPVLLGGCHCPRLRPRRISANGRGLLECYRRRGLQKVVPL